MSTERDVTRVVKTWLDAGPTALPDPVLRSVMEHVPATRQRHPRRWSGWAMPRLSVPLRAALAAVAIGIVAVIGLGVPPGGDQVAGPSTSTRPAPGTSPAISPAISHAPPSIAPPPDLDAYVTSAYEGLVDLPPLTVTVVEVEGTKERYLWDGVGLLRNDDFGNATNDQPSSFRIFSRDTMAEVSDLDGQPIWLQHSGQGNPLSELAFATGLQRQCDAGWRYVGVETLIGRPTHHLACGDSAMWLDVATRLPLRSVRVQGGDLPTITFDVTELQIGPQPADLFQPPAGLRTMSDAEVTCAGDPACASPAPAITPRPIITPPPATGDLTAPADLDAFVAGVLTTYQAPPALEMLVERGDSVARYMSDGSGRFRIDEGDDPANQPVATYLYTDGHSYEANPQDDGSTLWGDQGPSAVGWIPDLGLGQGCRSGWQQRGFDLVLDRPTLHLVCGYDEYWIDPDLKLVLRHQRDPDPLAYETGVDQVLQLRSGPLPTEWFQLPANAKVVDAACISRGRLICAPSPSGPDASAATGTGPALVWSQVELDDRAFGGPAPGRPRSLVDARMAWLGDRFFVADPALHAASESRDGRTWTRVAEGDADWGYYDLLMGSASIATWQGGMVGWDAEGQGPGVIRAMPAPGQPVTSTEFHGPVGALGIGPAGMVARIHSGIDFDAYVTTVLGPDWVGQIKDFDYQHGVLHIATNDGRSADLPLGYGDVADRGYGWFSADGASWTEIPGFPPNVTDIAGVEDGFIARGESMWFSPDGMSWREIGATTEGPLLAWGGGAVVPVPRDRMVRWTADGGVTLPMTAGLPSATRSGAPAVGTGSLGLVAMGSSDVLFTPDGSDWSLRPMPDPMYASGGARKAPTVAVGEDAALVLMYSGEGATPSLWLGTPKR